jgi:hypothetical protein
MTFGGRRVFFQVIAIVLLVAFSLHAKAEENAAPTVYVARRGWHIDVGYAKQDLREPLLSIAKNFPDARYVFFGFGDMHYLADAKNQHGPAMLAALWPGPGIILVTTIQSAPASAFGVANVIALPATEQQSQGSQDYIWNSLITRAHEVAVYRVGPYEGSYYFLATAKYSAFHTCNTWAAQTLRAAGFPVRTQGVLFARQLWSQARRAQRRISERSPRQLQGGRDPS